MEKHRHLPFRLKLLCHITFWRIVFLILLAAALFFFPGTRFEWQLHFALMGDVRETDGEVTEVLEGDNDEYLFEYIFYNNDIGQRGGFGFFDEYNFYQVGDTIRVTYSAKNPDFNKATLMNAVPFSYGFGYFMALVILIFILILIWLIVKASKDIQRIERGRFLQALRIKMERIEGDNSSHYEFTYKYKRNDGESVKKKIIGMKEHSYAQHELVVIGPKDENKATFISSLPSKVSKYVWKLYTSEKKG